MTKHIVFVGGGNMGEALISGLLRSGHWKPSQIIACDVRHDRLAHLRRRYKVRVSADSRAAVGEADIVLLAVKPQQMKLVLEDLSPVVLGEHLVLSIAAGITTPFIEKFLAKEVPVIRIMPNTPALIGQGMAGMARGRFAKRTHERAARAIMETVGTVVSVPERQMDAVTAVSGSGPAYVFYVAEVMKDAGVMLGLSPPVADQLVRQTIKGAGALLAQSREEARALRERVSSPGGTTEAAIRVMEYAKIRRIFMKALKSAKDRSRELSRQSH